MNDNELRELRARWKALWVIATIIAVGLLIVAMAASPADAFEVCPEWDSGKIDVTGEQTTLRITAPEGFHIVEVCVKAGSSNEGYGPEYSVVDPPRRGMTISHSSGKAISHYSMRYEICHMPGTTTTTAPPATTTTSLPVTPSTSTTTVAPTTTQPPTTTTTIPTTTSTEPSESTTTVITSPPPTTSSTVETSTTSTSAPIATTSTAEPPKQSTTPTDELPYTGAGHVALFVVALFALVAGAGLVRLGGQR